MGYAPDMGMFLKARLDTPMGLTSSSGATPVLRWGRLLYASVRAPRSWSQDRGCSATSWLRIVCFEASAKNVKGPLTSAFPTAAAFVASLKGEQDRCLADMKWQVTQIVDGVSFDFYFRDVMDVAHDAFARARKVQLRGKRHANTDGTILRSNSIDSDVYLVREADVLNIHANALHRGKPIKAFAMAVQFFSDATLLSCNGGGLASPCAACVSVLGGLGACGGRSLVLSSAWSLLPMAFFASALVVHAANNA